MSAACANRGIVGFMDRPSAHRVRFRWEAADPVVTRERLRRAGFTVSSAGALVLPSLRVDVVAAAVPADRLVPAADDDGSDARTPGPTHPNGVVDLLAVGWATVDIDRSLAEGGVSAEREPSDPHLGAFAARIRTTSRGPHALLLEPNTEGRLVATLVRHGEGPAALYFGAGVAGLAGAAAAVRTTGGLPTAVADGPLGPSILLAGGPVSGPHLLVVDRPSDPGDDTAEPGTIGA